MDNATRQSAAGYDEVDNDNVDELVRRIAGANGR